MHGAELSVSQAGFSTRLITQSSRVKYFWLRQVFCVSAYKITESVSVDMVSLHGLVVEFISRFGISSPHETLFEITGCRSPERSDGSQSRTRSFVMGRVSRHSFGGPESGVQSMLMDQSLNASVEHSVSDKSGASETRSG